MNIASTPKRIAIFRAGDRTTSDGRAVSFSVADLEQIARNYDPALGRAPLVVGHPRVDDPAFGWATKLSVEGDTLMADVDQVEAQFATMVNEGRFPNRSAAIFLPTTPGNPRPGELYLKHVGFLGAAVPAVPGLPPVQFAAESEAAPVFTFSAASTQPESSMDEKPTKVAPVKAGTVPEAGVDPANFAAQLAARETDISKREAQVLAREAKLGADAAAAERCAAATFAAALVASGKVLPKQEADVVELLVALPGADAPLTFAQGSGGTVSRPAREVLRSLLDGMPARINYREKSAGADAHNAAVSFAAPAGTQIDAERGDQYARIKALQAANPKLSVIEAARLVGA